MSKTRYEELVKEDLEWLLQQPRTLERDHIACIVRNSVETYYSNRASECKQCGSFNTLATYDGIVSEDNWHCGNCGAENKR